MSDWDGDHYYTIAEVSGGTCCRGSCEFHGQLWCKFYNRPCSEYCYPDKRPVYLTPEKAVEQALRLIPMLEADIAAGETRSIFFDLLEMHREILRNA